MKRLESYNRLIEARRLVYRYNGRYSFMVAMQMKALSDRDWLPSQKQAKAIFARIREEIGEL